MKYLIISQIAISLFLLQFVQVSAQTSAQKISKKDSIFNEFVQFQLKELKLDKDTEKFYRLNDTLPVKKETRTYSFLDSLRNDLASCQDSQLNDVLSKHYSILEKNHPDRLTQLSKQMGNYYLLKNKANKLVQRNPDKKSVTTKTEVKTKKEVVQQGQKATPEPNPKSSAGWLIYLVGAIILVINFILFRKISELENKIKAAKNSEPNLRQQSVRHSSFDQRINEVTTKLNRLEKGYQQLAQKLSAFDKPDKKVIYQKVPQEHNPSGQFQNERYFYAKFADGANGFNLNSLSENQGPTHFFKIVLNNDGSNGTYELVSDRKVIRNLILRINDILLPVAEVDLLPKSQEDIPVILEKGLVVKDGEYLKIKRKLKLTFKN